MRKIVCAAALLLGAQLTGCGGSGSEASHARATATASAAPLPSALVSADVAASTSAIASVDAPEDPPSAVPSSSAPMPKGLPGPTETESQKIWREAVELASLPATLKCADVVSARTRLAFSTAPHDLTAIKSQKLAYQRIARCAESLASYGFLLELGRTLQKADPADGHPEIVARALLGKRRPKEALAMLDVARKAAPASAYVAMTFAKVYCAMAEWSDCRSSAEAALKLNEGEQNANEKRRTIAGANKYLARALVHGGALDDAAAKLEIAEKHKGRKKDIEDIRAEIAMARAHATIASVDVDDEVLLGIYHLVGKLKDLAPLVQVNVENLEDADVQYRVQVEIQGVTQQVVETITVKKKGAKRVELNPALRADFDINKIRAPESTSVSVKVTKVGKGGDQVVDQRTIGTVLDPRDYLPFGAYDDEMKKLFKRDHRLVAAWVTPNDTSVDEFLKEAKKKLPKGQSFSGEQSSTVPQVKALFEALRGRGVSYVMDPEALSVDVRSQRIRLPNEVLASTNAQCLEGSILYATLLESIGLKPFVVYVPGHAFLAWKPGAKDKTEEKLFFLETTMTGGAAPFEKAMELAGKRYAADDAKKTASLADISQLRKDGVTPQPAQHKKH